ncbi:MAG: hypothetical protein K2W92_02000 [Alphaproteobacteria bacterium]|nr:hypothetical protein [Alphaproteobacteria bacterium]
MKIWPFKCLLFEFFFYFMKYVLNRSQFGWPLAANQLIQAKLVHMQTDISLATLGG